MNKPIIKIECCITKAKKWQNITKHIICYKLIASIWGFLKLGLKALSALLSEEIENKTQIKPFSYT